MENGDGFLSDNKFCHLNIYNLKLYSYKLKKTTLFCLSKRLLFFPFK